MRILSLAYIQKAESDFEKSVLRAFVTPLQKSNNIIEADLHISAYSLNYYDQSLICNSYAEAHKKAYLTLMSEEDYEFLYKTSMAYWSQPQF